MIIMKKTKLLICTLLLALSIVGCSTVKKQDTFEVETPANSMGIASGKAIWAPSATATPTNNAVPIPTPSRPEGK